MQIKQKLSSFVNHVKSNPVAYTFVATSIVVGAGGLIGTAIAEKRFYETHKLVDLKKALEHITDKGLTGLYYKMDDVTTLVLIPTSSENFPS